MRQPLSLQDDLFKILHALKMHVIQSLRPLILKNPRAMHEGLLVLDEETRICRVYLRMQPCIHTNGIDWARLDTVSAINTEERVYFVTLRKLLYRGILMLARLYVDAARGAGSGAQEARGTLDITVIL
jgi:hypothetical protein